MSWLSDNWGVVALVVCVLILLAVFSRKDRSKETGVPPREERR